MKSFIPSREDYLTLLETDLFRDIEAFSNAFLNLNKHHLTEYASKWVPDPLHQWSRQWEYPYVYEKIRTFLTERKTENPVILDAGSGVTFFPFYINAQFPSASIHCADYDSSYGKIFEKVTQKMQQAVHFSNVSLMDTGYSDSFFDAIYCISVLEHAKDYLTIIDELNRIMKPGGKLIVTFDISLDAKHDISPEDAAALLDALTKAFHSDREMRKGIHYHIQEKSILTTRSAYRINPKLIWFTPPPAHRMLLRNIKDLIRGKGLASPIPLLTVFCISLTKSLG